MYGLGLDEFWIGGVLATHPPPGHAFDSVWHFLRDIGVKVVEMRESQPETYWHIDALATAALPDERLIPNLGAIARAGNGREAVLFPFDSAQSYYYQNVFASRSGGDTATNPGVGTREQTYDAATTATNQTVCSQMAFGYTPDQHRWPVAGEAINSTMDCSGFITRQIGGLESPLHYITVAGHMFDPQTGGGGGANDNDVVLTVQVWCEVPKGTNFQNANGESETVASDYQYLFRSFNVLKRDLSPAPGPNPDYNTYHSVTFEVDMQTAPGTLRGGPYHPNNGAHRFDIRVVWTGAEKVALRAVTLRDRIGWLVRGDAPECETHRAAMRAEAFRIMNDSAGTPPAPRRAIMRFYSGDEGKMFEHGPFDGLDSMLAATAFGGGGNTLTGVRAYRAQALHLNSAQHTLDNERELSVELYMGDVWYRRQHNYVQFQGVSDVQLPSLAEHNGGKWYVPLMLPRADEVTRYERFMQRYHMGAYITGSNSEYNYGHQFANELGHAAWSSRRTGRRLITWPGVMAPFNIQPEYDKDGPDGVFVRADTSWSHIIEAGELRAITNLGLIYGARGVHYSWIGSDTQEVYMQDRALRPRDTVQRWFFYNDFGPVGPLTSMQENRRDTMLFRRRPEPDGLRPSATFVNFYTGWGNRLDEMRWLNRTWLPRIGAAMAPLRWRDAYSMHFTVEQTYMPTGVDGRPQTRSRPLPADEIVKELRAYDPNGLVDPPAETYVELGLFDTQKGYAGGQPYPLGDTNYIMVLNRRTFERPNDIDSTTPLGRLLDTLAEARTLRMRLNLKHPFAGQYGFLRITELAPDPVPLPLHHGFRPGLDTVIGVDSAFVVDLRPGGASLLRITYCPPETAFGPAELRRSSQRKLIYIGDRYYATYARQLTSYHPKDSAPANRMPVVDDAVFLRRSYPMADTIGAILWENEILVSDTNSLMTVFENRFPSITARPDVNGAHRIAVVWTRHGGDAQGPGYTVHYRNVFSPRIGIMRLGPMDFVGVAHTTLGDSVYGTPVVSALDGGDAIAWTDQTFGVLARFRTLGPWNTLGTYSVADSVSMRQSGQVYGARFPSMPPFVDLAARDSSVGIVWQATGTVIPSQIWYARLFDTVVAGAHRLFDRNHLRLSTTADLAFNPSIDLAQNHWHRLYEGVTWEEGYMRPSIKDRNTTVWQTQAVFRSLHTPTTMTPNTHDSVGMTQLWGLRKMIVSEAPLSLPAAPFVFPNAGSLNEAIDTAHGDDSLMFSVVYHRNLPGAQASSTIGNALIRFPMEYFARETGYAYKGYRPNGAASPNRQPDRFAALYQQNLLLVPQHYDWLNTSRQFYAKSRPTGYTAYGREAQIRLSDTAPATFRLVLDDVWKADPTNAGGAAMRAAEVLPWQPDSLNGLRSLMWSGTFSAHDSTTIGFYVQGDFTGNTGRAGAASVRCRVELLKADAMSAGAVALLDSFTITPSSGAVARYVERDLDLLSGEYVVRMTIDTAAIVFDAMQGERRYESIARQAEVADPALAKARLVARGASAFRVMAYPNPISGTGELRFSVSGNDPVSLLVHDGLGRLVMRVIDREVLDEGRYALDVDTRSLAPGTYLVELRAGTTRAVTKMVVVR